MALVTSYLVSVSCLILHSHGLMRGARGEKPKAMILFQPTEGRAVSLLEGIMNDIYIYMLAPPQGPPFKIKSCVFLLLNKKYLLYKIVYIYI